GGSPTGRSWSAGLTWRVPTRCVARVANLKDSQGPAEEIHRTRLGERCRDRVTLTVRVMRILDRYIVREIFRHALLGLVVFTFVFFVPQLVRLMELLVRHAGSGGQLVKLFACLFPSVLIFTVPMAILVGVLLGLGRMSADSEIIALTALGIGRRRILLPVAVLALTGVLITAAMTLWAGPLALRT